MLVAGPAVARVSIVTALILTGAAGLPLRDPDHVAGRRLAMRRRPCRGARGARRRGPRRVVARARAGRRARRCASVRRERWTRARGVAVGSALVSFYVTYLAYRNLKSVVPVAPAGRALRSSAGRARPRSVRRPRSRRAAALAARHRGLGRRSCRARYMLFFAFIPGTLAFALVFSRDLQAGLFYTTAQSINWLLGAGSYFLLPSLGPVYVEPAAFARPADLGGDASCRTLLLDQRLEFLRDPAARHGAEHRRVLLAARLDLLHRARWRPTCSGSRRGVKIAAWLLLGLTIRVHDLPRLALRPRRRRRPDHRRDGGRARPRADRLRSACRATVHAEARACGDDATPPPRWPPAHVLAGPAVALVTVVAALLVTDAVGLPLRDPDHVAALYLALVGFGTWRCSWGSTSWSVPVRLAGGFPPSRAAMRASGASAGPLRPGVAVGSALVGFYATYMAYRNLKSIVPLIRPGDHFDQQLADLDRSLFGGHDPAALLHTPPRDRASRRTSCRPRTWPSSSSCR